MNKQHTRLATLVEDLEVQRDFLAEENASFANYLEDSGYSQNEIDLIAQGWHGSVKERLVENSRLTTVISDLQEEIEIIKRREEHFATVLRVEEQKNLNLAKANMSLEKSLKDRERRLDSIMGLANGFNYGE
jgi:predicted RNase H-like nuclease (RuvC/YqgF family)